MNRPYSLLSPRSPVIQNNRESGPPQSSENVGVDKVQSAHDFFKKQSQSSEESVLDSITSESRPTASPSSEAPNSSIIMLPPDTTSSTQPGTPVTALMKRPVAKLYDAVSVATNEVNTIGSGSLPSLSTLGAMVTPSTVIGISDHHRGPSILRQKSRSITGYGSGVSFRSSARPEALQALTGGSIDRRGSLGNRTRAEQAMFSGSRRSSVQSSLKGAERRRQSFKGGRRKEIDDFEHTVLGPEEKVIVDFWNASSMLIDVGNDVADMSRNKHNTQQEPHDAAVQNQSNAVQRVLANHAGRQRSNSEKSSRTSKRSRRSRKSIGSSNSGVKVGAFRKRLSIAAAAAVFRRIGSRVRTATRSLRKKQWHASSWANQQNNLETAKVKDSENTTEGKVENEPLLTRAPTEKSLKSLKDMEEDYRVLSAFADEGIEGVKNLRQQQQQQHIFSEGAEKTDSNTSQTRAKPDAPAISFNIPHSAQNKSTDTIRIRYPTPPPNRQSLKKELSLWKANGMKQENVGTQPSPRREEDILKHLLDDDNNYLADLYGHKNIDEDDTGGSASTGFTGVTALTGPLTTSGADTEGNMDWSRAMLTKRHSIHDFSSRNGTRTSLRPSGLDGSHSRYSEFLLYQQSKNNEEVGKKTEKENEVESDKKADHFFLADTVGPTNKEKALLKSTYGDENKEDGNSFFYKTDGTNEPISQDRSKKTPKWRQWAYHDESENNEGSSVGDNMDSMNEAMTAQQLSSFKLANFDTGEEKKNNSEILAFEGEDELEADEKRREQREALISMGVIYDGYKSEEEEKDEDNISQNEEKAEDDKKKEKKENEIPEVSQGTLGSAPNSNQPESLAVPLNSAETRDTTSQSGLRRRSSSSILRSNTSANAVTSRVCRRRDEIEAFWVSKPRLPFGWTVSKNINYSNSVNWHEVYFRWCSRCKASEGMGQNLFFREIVDKSHDLYIPELDELEPGDYGIAAMYYTVDDIPRTLWGDQVLNEQFELAKWVVDEDIERHEYRRARQVAIARNILSGRWGAKKVYRGVPQPFEMRVKEDGAKTVALSHQYEFSGATRTAEIGHVEMAGKLPMPVPVQGFYGGIALPSGFPRTNLAWATYLCKKNWLTRRLAVFRMNKKLDKYRLRVLEQQLVFEQPQLRRRRSSTSSQGSLGGTSGAVGIELARKLNQARRLAFGHGLDGIDAGSEEEKRWLEEYEAVRILNKRTVRKFSDEYEGLLRRMIEQERHERILIEEANAVRERALKSSRRLCEEFLRDEEENDDEREYNALKRVWKKHFDAGARQARALARVELHSNGMSRNNSRATERSLSFLGYSGSSRNMRSAEQQFIERSAKIPSELLPPRRRPSSARRLVSFVSGSSDGRIQYQQNGSNVRSMLLEEGDKEDDTEGVPNGTRTSSGGLGRSGTSVSKESGVSGTSARVESGSPLTRTITPAAAAVGEASSAGRKGFVGASQGSGGLATTNVGSGRLDSSGTSNGSLAGILKRPESCSVGSMIIEGPINERATRKSGGPVIGVVADNEGRVYGSPGL